jgi:hypothetical protein
MNIRKAARALTFIPAALLLSTLGPTVAHATPGDPEGSSTQMPAFFNDNSVTVNMKEMPAGAEPNILRNPSHNTIYAVADLDDVQKFPPVINAIQGDGFNPLWAQMIIHFNGLPLGTFPAGFTGFTSEAAVLAAVGTGPGQITLTSGGEVYRCSVVSPSPRPA